MIYSHSRLSTFEQCPLKFKYHYIDELETEIEQGIEAFMGNLVHEALEKLYKELKYEKLNSPQELLDYYHSEWEKRYNDKIVVVKKDLSSDNYRKMGEKFIRSYYESHKPFDEDTTIATEMNITINLDLEGRYAIRGFIDRLSCKGDVYEVHDYKTSGTLPDKEHIDHDRQLALYSIAVKEKFADAKKVRLVWHYLAFEKDLVSERTDEELIKLKADTVELIKRIEETREFNPSSSALCDWCEYMRFCPKWKHMYETENLPANEYLKESGVALANRYTELSVEKGRIEAEMEKVKEALFAYCEKNQVEVVFSPHCRLNCKTYLNMKFPGKDDPMRPYLEEVLRKIGRYEEAVDIDSFKLSRLVQNGSWRANEKEAVKSFAKIEPVRRIYISQR